MDLRMYCSILWFFFIYAEISSTPGEFYIFKFQQPSKRRRYQASGSTVYVSLHMQYNDWQKYHFHLFRIFSASASISPFLSITNLALLKFIYAPIQILNILPPLFSNPIYFTFPTFLLSSWNLLVPRLVLFRLSALFGLDLVTSAI